MRIIKNKGVKEGNGKQRFFVSVFLVISSSFITAFCPSSQEPILSEYKVKAVFLFNFTQFVDWPADAFQNDDDPFVIGILGDDPFGSYLDETVKGETFSKHPLVVKRYNKPEEVGGSHILFIAETDNEKLKKIFKKINPGYMLTVGDARGFAKLGGAVEFKKEGNRVRLKINPDSASSVGLNVSSKLLRLADIVTTDNDNLP